MGIVAQGRDGTAENQSIHGPLYEENWPQKYPGSSNTESKMRLLELPFNHLSVNKV